jgi:hypothetical protein
MGTTKSVAPTGGQQHHTLTHQSSNNNLHNNNNNRTSLKASANQVRWPVSLNQLAAISLDDDSDFDRSLTDGTFYFSLFIRTMGNS